MGFQNDSINSKYKKHIVSLRKSATRAKSDLKDAIQKSQKRFFDRSDKLEIGEEKNRVLKKLHKATEGLQILENLSEDDIIEFALTTTKKVMAVASNPRVPKEMRMKARVASHKPLFSHLARVQSLVEAGSDESESEEATEAAGDGVKLDKITINNQIVKMRGDVKRAKVHLIHKFTRNVRILQKAKEGKKAKCERKIERFVKKIKHIKEVEADDVSRFALSTKTEDVKKLLADIKIPMKSQVMAIITLQQFVAASVENFRETFPDWSKTVPSLLKKKKKKRKLNVEVVSNANKKVQKNVKGVNDNDGEDNKDSEKADSENDSNSDVGDSDNEEESVISNSENEEENGVKVRGIGQIYDRSGEEDSEKDESDQEKETENNHESEGENEEMLSSNEEFQSDSETVIKPEVKNIAVKGLKRNLELPKTQPINKKPKTTVRPTGQKKSNIVVKKNDGDIENGKHSHLKKSSKPKVVKEKPKVVDPFFMTTSNEEYLTSQVPTVNDGSESNWKSKSDDFNQTRFDKFSKFNYENKWRSRKDDWKQNKCSNEDSRYNQNPFVQRSEKASFNKEPIPFNMFANRKERRKAQQQPPQEAKVEKLHPSWEAKKKQTSIASFQGKKIVFD